MNAEASEYHEIITGTDLCDSTDAFGITAFDWTPGGTSNLSAPGKTSRSYQLWRPEDLAEWLPIGSPTGPLDAAGAIQLSDPTTPDDRAFYRIEVSLIEDSYFFS